MKKSRERPKKRARISDASKRRHTKPGLHQPRQPRVVSKVSSLQVPECSLPYFFLDSVSKTTELPPIPRMKRKEASSASSLSEAQLGPSACVEVAKKPHYCVSSQAVKSSRLTTEGKLRGTLSCSQMRQILPTAQGRSISAKQKCAVRRSVRSKAVAKSRVDETWSPPTELVSNKLLKTGRPSERPRRRKRKADEAFEPCVSVGDEDSKAERESTPPTRVQPKRGRGLPLCRRRVVQVYSRLLARAGPSLKRSVRIVNVEKRLHKGYSDIPSLSERGSSILKKAPIRRELFLAPRGTSSSRRQGQSQSWKVQSKRSS